MATPKESDSISELTAKLEICDLEIQNFITALKAENKKLHKKIAKLQADKVSLSSEIEILREEQSKTIVNYTFGRHKTS
jgi:predicted RNase H-like nuclease (RuvC/YqgF family)